MLLPGGGGSGGWCGGGGVEDWWMVTPYIGHTGMCGPYVRALSVHNSSTELITNYHKMVKNHK